MLTGVVWMSVGGQFTVEVSEEDKGAGLGGAAGGGGRRQPRGMGWRREVQGEREDRGRWGWGVTDRRSGSGWGRIFLTDRGG